MDQSIVYVKDLDLMNKKGVNDSRLSRPIAKLLVPTNKGQFWIYDDPDNGKWNDYILNGGKFTIYGDKLVFENSGKIFTLRGDVMKMITNYIFNTTHSPDAKPIIDFMDDIRFDIYARGKSSRDRNLLMDYFIKKLYSRLGW